MPTWEVRKVSGKGFLHDIPIAAYKDLDELGVEDLKTVHNPLHIGTLEDFVVLDHLLKQGYATDEDYDALQTCWKGEPLPAGTVYCVVMDWESAPGAPGEAVKKSFKMNIEDRIVQAEGDKPFKSGGVESQVRKNVAQAKKEEGGVWGKRRVGPPRF